MFKRPGVILKATVISLVIMAILVPSSALATCFTETNFSIGPIEGPTNIPVSKGDFAFNGGFESGRNISYQDGNISLADPTVDGELVSSPINISANTAGGSFQLMDLGMYFVDDYPPGTNAISEISVQYRVDMGEWKTAEQEAGQNNYQLYHQNCEYPASNPEHLGYKSCSPDISSYSRAGSTVQYKILWRGTNPPRTSLNKIRNITVCGEKSSIKVASSSAASATPRSSKTSAQTTTVVKLEAPTLLQLNDQIISENPQISLKSGEEIILAGRTYPNNMLKLSFSNEQVYETTANDLGNWAYGLVSLPPGDYTLSGESLSADGSTSGKKELYKFSVGPIAATSGAIDTPPNLPNHSTYYLGGAGVLLVALLALAFILRHKTNKVLTSVKSKVIIYQPSKLLSRSFLCLTIFLLAGLAYIYSVSGYHQKLALAAFDSGNYKLASDFYRQALRVPVIINKELSTLSNDASQKALFEINYSSALQLAKGELSKESCAQITSTLGSIAKDDSRYQKSREVLLNCQVASIKAALDEHYPDKVSDPERVVVLVSGGKKSASQSTPGYTPSRSSSGIQAGFCGSTAELWQGFCLVGNESWKNKMKEALNHIAAISPDRYAVVQDHARTIYMLQDFVEGDPSTNDYNPYPLGGSNCGNVINMRLNERYGDHFALANMQRLVEVIVHEANHGQLAETDGMCDFNSIVEIHQIMWDRWENTFNQQATAYFSSH